MKISGAIFDMDGTLLDSMHVWDKVGIKYAVSRGITPRDDFEYRISKMTMSQVSEYLSTEYGLAAKPQEIIDGINLLVEEEYRNNIQPKPGVQATLERLRDKGVKMCVATASDLHLAKMVLERTGLIRYFTQIVTCTMVGEGKQSPRIFEFALEQLGTSKAETPVFEDALYALKTAKSAGFIVVGVYDAHMRGDSAEIEALSDYYIRDYRESSLF